MTRRTKSDPAVSIDRKLSVLEAELTKATEDFRLAKLAAREAKAQAKIVKKEMKRIRRAWVAALAEQDQAISAANRQKAQAAAATKARAKKKPATGVNAKRRVAGSPEIVRKSRDTKKPRVLETAAMNVIDDSPSAESVVASASEPGLGSEAAAPNGRSEK
jgi:hypothetical protein